MADAGSDSGFARLCFAQQCRKGHTRILKLSAGCGHTRGVFKTWKNTDHRRCKNRRVRNATFFDPNFQMHFHLKSNGMIFFSYYLAHQKGCPLKASSPFRLFLTLTHPQMRRQRQALRQVQFPLRCPPSRLPRSQLQAFLRR